MKLLEAAERVLRSTARPMHSAEIIEYAKKRCWITPKGRTPDHSLQAAIWRNMKELGRRSPFVVLGGGTINRKYSLRLSIK
jgi:hypothetical protein